MSVSNEDALAQTLRQDATVSGLLAQAQVGSFPAVFEGWAPDNQVEPYITFRFELTHGEPWPQRIGLLAVDIWDVGPSGARARTIRDAVLLALDRQILESDESGANLRLYSSSEAPVPEDSPDSYHLTMNFDVRTWRQAQVAAT